MRLAAVLHAGIAPIAAELIGEARFEVGNHGVGAVLLQDEEVVALGRIFFAGSAGDAAILNRPMISAALPIAQVLAVEEAFEARLDAVLGKDVCCNSRAERQRSQILHELLFHISWAQSNQQTPSGT